MAVGPVDVVIVGFPGNKFTGDIAPALLDLADQGILAPTAQQIADMRLAYMAGAYDLFCSQYCGTGHSAGAKMPRWSATTSRPTARPC